VTHCHVHRNVWPGEEWPRLEKGLMTCLQEEALLRVHHPSLGRGDAEHLVVKVLDAAQQAGLPNALLHVGRVPGDVVSTPSLPLYSCNGITAREQQTRREPAGGGRPSTNTRSVQRHCGATMR
jgi:hypothetical protein